MGKTDSESDRISLVISVDEDRVGAIIGPKGQVEKTLEHLLNVQIKIFSSEGKVLITTEGNNIDSALRARMVIEAISYGFSFNDAKILIDNPDSILEVLDILEFIRHKHDLQRVKSRIIGKQGKIKKQIEAELNVKISIRRHYIAIIGKYDDALAAKDAIIMLCRGSKYSRVMQRIESYKFSKLV